MTDKQQLKELIEQIINTNDSSVTIDWLSYCIFRSVDFEVLEESIVETNKSIRAGIPAVGTIKLIDNDFYQCQSDSWKDEYRLLCRSDFTICVLIINDVKYLDERNVTITTKKIFIKFNDPESVPNSTISTSYSSIHN